MTIGGIFILILFGLLYVAPLVLCLAAAILNLFVGRDKDTSIGWLLAGFIPLINIAWICLDWDDYDGLPCLLKKVDFASFSRLSPETTRYIKQIKEVRDIEIERIKAECKRKVLEVKEVDKKKVLLDRLGLTEEDLQYIKDRK